MSKNPYDNPANPSDWPEALKGDWFTSYEFAIEVARDQDKRALLIAEVKKLREVPDARG